MGSMLSLLDVLPRHERIDIGSDQIFDVYGISGGDIGKILERFPDAFQQIADSGSQPSAMNPNLLGALVAASAHVGSNGDYDAESLLGNEKAEKRASTLGVADQAKIMQAIGRCTFPEGVGPFLEDLVLMSSSTATAMDLVVKVASKAQATTLPPKPKPSEPPETPASGS